MEVRNTVTTSARWKISKTIVATGADQARHGLAVTSSWRRCKARNAVVTTSSRRKSGATACKARCASGCRCEPGTTSAGAQAWSTAAKGMPAREDDGCGQWPASL